MKIIIILSLTFFLLVVSMPVKAVETIDNYDVIIYLNEDSSLDINEKITYSFGDAEKHGIYRDIPYSYERSGLSYNIIISDITVRDENGQSYVFNVSNVDDKKRIKIGDADKLISGTMTYVISYKIKRVINYFNDHDELYWNVTGNEWAVPINRSQAKIILPQRVDNNNLQAACYWGLSGKTNNCSYNIEHKNQNSQIIYAQDNLSPANGITIVLAFPKNIVRQSSVWENIFNLILDNLILFLPVVVFIILFCLWYARGRDPKGQGTIIPQYDVPDNLTPAEVGTIIDQRVDNFDISSEIVNLAIKNYIKIHYIEDKNIFYKFSKDDNYILERTILDDKMVNEFQNKLMSEIFKSEYIKPYEVDTKIIEGVKLTSLKNNFFKDLKQIKKLVYQSVIDKGYLDEKQFTSPIIYSTVGIFILVILGFLFERINLAYIVSVGLSALMIIIFGYFMPKRTKKGVLTKEYLLGLKNYMTVAERDRIKFHNAPEKKPEVFEKLLPYAMVMKVEKGWADQFKDIYIQQPNWYNNPNLSTFNAVVFASSLNSFNQATVSILGSKPRSAGGGSSGLGGGGFSGGGFGGGGGSSW